MKIHELINNTPDFSAPIVIDFFDDTKKVVISKGLNRKTLLALYGDKDIVSIGTDDDYLCLTISI